MLLVEGSCPGLLSLHRWILIKKQLQQRKKSAEEKEEKEKHAGDTGDLGKEDGEKVWFKYNGWNEEDIADVYTQIIWIYNG